MEPRFLVTVDTESDRQWDPEPVKSVDNILALPRFQELCDAYGVRPTYLTTWPVVEDEEASAVLDGFLKSCACEIGAHLHPWNNPPFEPLTADDHRHHPYPHEFSDEIFEAKLIQLRDAIEQRFGAAPVSYRAGRWGIKSAHLPILERAGFKADSSVVPGVDWSGQPGDPKQAGGPDFRFAPLGPYRPDPADMLKEGASSILEIPVTCHFNRPIGEDFRRAWLKRSNNDLSRRAMAKLNILKPLWLRPFPQTTAVEMIRLARKTLDRGLPNLVMMLHSSELSPGQSPYYPDAQSVDGLYRRLETTFKGIVRGYGVKPATMSEFVSAFNAK